MIALYIVVGIVLLIVLMLIIPLDLAFDFDLREEVRSRVRVGWLLGLVRKDIGRGRKKLEESRRRSLQPFLSLIRTEGVPGKLQSLVWQVLHRVKIRELDADLRVGLDDPADTGILCSLLWPALASFSPSGPVRVRVEPSFDEPVLEGGLSGRMRLFPIQLVGPLSRFVFSPAGWRTTRLMVSSWRKRR